MIQEMLKTFDEKGNYIGIASREDVHRLGLWHETFHCWLISRKEDQLYTYLQLRSSDKKDYPNLLDITAAGHLLSNERVEDGVREVEEELGLLVPYEKLAPVGVIPYSVTKEEFKDNELAHVFLYEVEHTFNHYDLQKEEVSGIFRIKHQSFKQLIQKSQKEVHIEGFVIQNGEKVEHSALVTIEKFVPHEHSYYIEILEQMDQFTIKKAGER